MAGKRSWFIVRRELLTATAQTMTKGSPMDALVFIPESYQPDKSADIDARTAHKLMRLTESPDNRMIVIGEVKAIEPAKFGHKLTLNQFAHKPMFMADDLYKRIVKTFGDKLEIWAQRTATRLLMIGTFYKAPSGVFSLDRVCFMTVNEHWIPFDTMDESILLDALHEQHRRFNRSLRYNLKQSALISVATLQDTGQNACALYIVNTDSEEVYQTAAATLFEEYGIESWAWHLDKGAMPALPAVQPYQPNTPLTPAPPKQK
jgi:hypothetical protein